jgi:tetratricopeptide (TPR) repeat protein
MTLLSAEEYELLTWTHARFAHDAPAGEGHVNAIRESVQRLVGLDVRSGGGRTSIIALRVLRAAELTLAPGAHRARVGHDLQAAVAELAEITGWLLCDANRHSASLASNRRALGLARLAGDHSMELFVTHNLSLQATYLRQPEHSLKLVRPILDRGGLTPRLGAMFRLRLARAYAQMGLRRMALKTLDTATGLFYEGARGRDPAWSWWISERGFHHATGAMLGALGDWKAAIEPIHSALEAAPEEASRDRFLYMCVLLHAQIKVGAWREAETTAGELVPYIGNVRSTRPLVRLLATLNDLVDIPHPAAMDDAVLAIKSALVNHGIERSLNRPLS